MNRVTVVLVFALGVAGCATNSGSWSEEGFEQTTYGWKAGYRDGGQDILGSEWRLANWTKNADGSWDQKGAAPVDENGDGLISVYENKKAYAQDLKFTNVHNNGIIWVKTHTLEEADASKDLDVLLENYVGVLTSGPARFFQNLKAVVSSRSDVKLDKHPAVSALVSLEPADKSKDNDTKAQFDKIHLVLTRFDYLGPVEGATSSTSTVGSLGPSQTTAGLPGTRPRRTAMLVVGYVNDNERFDTGVADFAKLLAQLKLPDPPAASKKPGGKKPAPGATPATPAKGASPEGTTPKADPPKLEPDPANPAIEI